MELLERDGKTFVPLEFAKLGEGMGCHGVRARTADELSLALRNARGLRDRPTVIHLEVDRERLIGDYEGWWDVPQPAVDAVGKPTEAREKYLAEKAKQILR
jgi:TPP-dependent trihydroxycyclohexane-1,2-dione (THcHDO) dehydratase